MNVSVYELIVPQFTLSLRALKNLLQKGKTFADSKKIDMSVLLQTRLAPDMFPLIRQIQIATDSAKLGTSRLTGVTAPVFEDKEQTYEEIVSRIDNTISFLNSIKPEQFKEYESKIVKFSFYPGVYIEGKDYLIQHMLPNFYFHVSTAYAILRSNGIEIGKKDYLGEQNWKKET